MVQIVWFKRDLRITDHRPLSEAAAKGPVVPLYIAEPELWRLPDMSGRQWAFARDSLVELRRELAFLGAPLVVRIGDACAVLSDLVDRTGAATVWAHEETGNLWTYARDRRVASMLRERGVGFIEIPQTGVIRPLKSRRGWAGAWDRRMAETICTPPENLFLVKGIEPGIIPAAEDLGLADDPCPGRQTGGAAEGWALLGSFLDHRGANYHREMSSPLTAFDSCSRLSPHLACGTLSLREVSQMTQSRADALRRQPRERRGFDLRAVDAFVGRLHWHCHFMQKLEDQPEIETSCLHPFYDNARPETELTEGHLQAWASGRTGWPFVDACMRALNETGWINFRMRAMLMAVASYHLWLDWRLTGPVLARFFTDYEPGIHWSQVQMQSGTTGINTPRIYNPVKQSMDQDPDGLFIRRFVPELAAVPDAFIHEPWRMPPLLQADIGCRIGGDYPKPIVDHLVAAREARSRITTIRRRDGYWSIADEIVARHGSRKRNPRGPDWPKTKSNKTDSKHGAQLRLDV